MYPHHIEGTLYDSSGYASFVTPGVTYLSHVGFGGFFIVNQPH
jgi:hypothetical protein